MKKHIALAIAAVLSLALVAPVFAQPFADVPGEHWAFDAIAELAAKGILEGYPDGTFKGDRAMTRYEMAMALARILARIEAIKIPPPPKIPPPEVTRADIDRLTRLLNEFRAELSALGVRITALEEQIAAVKARLDNTYITGDITYIYAAGNISSCAPVTPSCGANGPQVQRNRIRLTFRGRLSPEFAVFLRARWNSLHTGGTHSAITDFDRLRTDWASQWGLNFSVGREYWALGPQGYLLLLSTSREGARVTASFGGIGLTALGFWNSGGGGSKTYGVRAELAAIAGWTIGINYRRDQDVYYPGTTTPGTNGSGFSVDWTGSLMGPLTFSGEYASYSATGGCPVTAVGNGCTALFAQLGINLGTLVGAAQFSPMLNVYYKDIRASFPTNCGGSPGGGGTTFCSNAFSTHQGLWLGFDFTRVTGWGADLTVMLTSRLAAAVVYESGTVNSTFGQSVAGGFVAGDRYTSFLVRGTYTLSRQATFDLEWHRLNNNTTGVSNLGTSGYAARVNFRW